MQVGVFGRPGGVSAPWFSGGTAGSSAELYEFSLGKWEREWGRQHISPLTPLQMSPTSIIRGKPVSFQKKYALKVSICTSEYFLELFASFQNTHFIHCKYLLMILHRSTPKFMRKMCRHARPDENKHRSQPLTITNTRTHSCSSCICSSLW